MKSVYDIEILENIPVLVRAALNEPVADGVVQDQYRLQRALPTIRYLTERHARVVLISHIDGLTKGTPSAATLKPVADALGALIPGVRFCPETIGPRAREAIRELPPGGVLMLENLRRNKGETLNELAFAKELAALGDVFVQDSFDTCHRVHASIVGVPKLLPSHAGILLAEEMRELGTALTPKAPSLAIIGGAKFGTKEPVLAALLARYDRVFVGGALANDFLKARGYPVGKSLVSDIDDGQMKMLLAHPGLILPADSIVAPAGNPTRQAARVATLEKVGDDEMILDQGPGTQVLLANLAARANTILWNGPLGNYENGFVDGTDALAKAIAASKARSVIGGGDTIAAIESLRILKHFSFVSTGGGAMLDFLTNGTLPGIEALG